MGSTCGQGDIGIHRGALALVDQGVIPEYLHGADRTGESRGDIGGDMHRRGQGGVVVGSSDGDSPATGERGCEATGRGTAFVLEKGDGASGEDQEDAEDNVLDETALGLRDFKGGHTREQRAHTTPASILIEGRVLLGRLFKGKSDKYGLQP